MNLNSFHQIYQNILEQEIKLSQDNESKDKDLKNLVKDEKVVNNYTPTIIFAKTRF